VHVGDHCCLHAYACVPSHICARSPLSGSCSLVLRCVLICPQYTCTDVLSRLLALSHCRFLSCSLRGELAQGNEEIEQLRAARKLLQEELSGARYVVCYGVMNESSRVREFESSRERGSVGAYPCTQSHLPTQTRIHTQNIHIILTHKDVPTTHTHTHTYIHTYTHKVSLPHALTITRLYSATLHPHTHSLLSLILSRSITSLSASVCSQRGLDNVA
jgi:hypothetical protein